jgi:hypothetical protein
MIVNKISVDFPKDSDFLRKHYTNLVDGELKDLTAELEKFLSFHNFTTLADDDVAFSHIGKASTLSEAKLAYKATQRNENTVYLEFPNRIPNTSHVIMKVDSAQYTYANGNKMDLFENGIPGEAIYDDYYAQITVDPVLSTVESPAPTWSQPRDRGWSFTLANLETRRPDTATDLVKNDVYIAGLNLTGIPAIPSAGAETSVVDAIYKEIADLVLGGLKVQKYDVANKQWNDAPGSITYHNADSTLALTKHNFYINSIAFKDLEPVRVVWTGTGTVKSTNPYFGVQQWIRINPMPRGDSEAKHEFNRKVVYGDVTTWWDKYDEVGSPHLRFRANGKYEGTAIYSQDSSNRNVVIDVTFDGIEYGSSTPATYYWLKSVDLATFKDNFKIAYSVEGTTEDDFEDATDLVYIDVKGVEFLAVGRNTNGYSNGLNTIRITLDPSYKVTADAKYFYVSPKITFSDEKSTFGNGENWRNDFWGVYEIPDNF